MKRLTAIAAILAAIVVFPGHVSASDDDSDTEDTTEVGDLVLMSNTGQCIKSVDTVAGFAFSKCYDIEPYLKQRIRVRLYDYVTDREIIRRGPWITQNRLESAVLWNVYRYLYLSSRFVVVYA